MSEEPAAAPLEPGPASQIQPTPSSASMTRWLPWFDVARGFGLWISSVFLLLLVPSVFVLPYLIYRIAAFGPPSPEVIGSDKVLLFFSVLGILPTHLLTLVLAWMVISEGGRRPFWKAVGFEWPENTPPVLTVIFSGLLALGLFGLAWLVTALYGERKTDLDILIESSIYTRVATAFVAVATAPIIEEVIYRGILYPALQKAAGVGIAIMVVSLLFAGVHVYQYRNNVAVIIVITVLSFTLTAARALSGKMLPSFLIHLAFNGIQSVLIVAGGFKDILK